jgi:hypothetical protein
VHEWLVLCHFVDLLSIVDPEDSPAAQNKTMLMLFLWFLLAASLFFLRFAFQCRAHVFAQPTGRTRCVPQPLPSQ